MLRNVLFSLFSLCLCFATLTTPGNAQSSPAFLDYETSIQYDGDLVSPVLFPSMCKEDVNVCPWNFRTRLREGAAEDGINFNGAFTIVTWGCDTSCSMGAVIDRTDGRIYELPSGGLNYLFDKESSLLVVNPEPESYAEDGDIPDWLWREFYVFENGHFFLIHKDRGAEAASIADMLDTPHPIHPEILKDMEQLP